MKKLFMSILLISFTLTLFSCEKRIDVPEPEDYLPYGFKLPGETQLEVQQVTTYLKSQEALNVTPNHINYRHRIIKDYVTTMATDFGDWKNFYIYNDERHLIFGLADGADSMDKSNNIVAKARLSKIVEGQGFEVKEYHYKGDRITFYCISLYSFGGEKIRESELKGQRKKNYFPIWPVHNF